MDMKDIVVSSCGMWWTTFEYDKHHREEYPWAKLFRIPVFDDYEVDQAFSSIMAAELAKHV